MESKYVFRRAAAFLVLAVLACVLVIGTINVPDLIAYHTFQEGLRALNGEVLDSPLDALPDSGDLAFIVVWNSQCGACRKQMEVLLEVAREIQRTRKLRGRVFIVTVNAGESESAVRRYLAEKDMLGSPTLLGLPLSGTVPTTFFAARVEGTWKVFDGSEGVRSDLIAVAYEYLEYVDGL